VNPVFDLELVFIEGEGEISHVSNLPVGNTPASNNRVRSETHCQGPAPGAHIVCRYQLRGLLWLLQNRTRDGYTPAVVKSLARRRLTFLWSSYRQSLGQNSQRNETLTSYALQPSTTLTNCA
jgi:hypothetical protein